MGWLLLFRAGHIGLSPYVVITSSRWIQRRFDYRLIWEKSIESIFATYTHRICFNELLWLLNCIKYKVIIRHVHNIMMIPITRNHQEGEEPAKRSSVSSSVRWLIEGTVLNTREVPWGTKYVFIRAYYRPSMQCYVSYVVMLLPERQP